MSDALADAGVVRISVPTPFIVGPVNVYVIKQDPPILIDTGPRVPGAFEVIEEGLAREGLAVRDLAAILITHAHVDHIGLTGQLVAESGATTFAHPDAAAQTQNYDEDAEQALAYYQKILLEFGVPDDVAQRTALERAKYRPYGERVQIDHILEDGIRVGTFRTHFVPCHSSSDVLFHNESNGIAFVGDHLLKNMNPNPLIRLSPGKEPRAKALIELHESLARTRALDIQWVCPGHGAPFTDHQTVIDKLIGKNEDRTTRIADFLSNGPMSPYAVTKSLFPNLEEAHVYLGLSVAVGHLEVLEDRKLATSSLNDGLVEYTLAQS